jgi:hypothetical protein
MKFLDTRADISINVMSYNEHHLLIDNFDKYLVISNEFKLTFNLNLKFSDIENPQQLIDIFKLISNSKSSINLHVRHVSFSKIITCFDDIYSLIKNTFTRNLTFSEHLSIISSESVDSEYMWFLGAGDYPNRHALNILHSNDINHFDLISFEVHHSVNMKSNEILPKIKIRRAEAISSTVYKRKIINFQGEPEHSWPHLRMLCMQRHTLTHLLISFNQTRCAVYVTPQNNWQSNIKAIEIERINLALNYPSSDILEWEFSEKEISHSLSDLGFKNNNELIDLFNNTTRLN